MNMRQKLSQLANLALRIRPYFDLPVVGQPPIQGAITPPGMEVDGKIVPAGAIIAALTAMLAFCGPTQPFATSAGSSLTLSPSPDSFQRFTNGGAVTVTIDYAYNIVNALPYPYVGETFLTTLLTIAATTIATPTLSDGAVTLSGTTSLAASTVRWLQAQITQLSTVSGLATTAGTTFVSLAQVGSTNAFTVTLATNAVVPVVGQVIFINTTAGTLPPGWYPIVKVASATSFIIATPAGTVWTATAATIPGTAVVPASQYTPGLPGVFSPLLTLTSMGSAVTAAV